MAQALAIANQQIYLQLRTPLYNGQYYVGQFISFPNMAAADQFLQAAPECVRKGQSYFRQGFLIIPVLAATGCYIPPDPFCPCANNSPYGPFY